jgi:hypothetical protein
MLKMVCWRGARKSGVDQQRALAELREHHRQVGGDEAAALARAGLVMASVRRPAPGLNQRTSSWVRTARSSSTTGMERIPRGDQLLADAVRARSPGTGTRTAWRAPAAGRRR